MTFKRHPTKSLTKAQQKQQQAFLEAMRQITEQEKVDGLTVEERWERHVEKGD